MAHLIKFHRTKTKLVLDIALTAAYVVAMEPAFTGLTWHEWLGLGFGGAILIHILLSWKWVVTVTRRFLKKMPFQTRVNYLVNLALLVAVGMVVVSGIIISRNLNTSAALGISGQTMRTWNEIHAWSPNVALLIVGLHLGLHWNWIVLNTKRTLLAGRWHRPASRRAQVPQPNVQH